MLAAGEMEQRRVELAVEQKAVPMMFTGIGMEQMDFDLQGMFEKIMPRKHARAREMTVAEARDVLFEQECDALINPEKVNAKAIELAENLGIIFIDEMDKIVASEQTHGADVSRQGVQRDLLPIVEGTTVQTRYGFVRTDHILFIAAGAFHRAKPSDLMPELQGRFPIRVELKDLTKDDFVRILTRAEGRADQAIRSAAEDGKRRDCFSRRRGRRPGRVRLPGESDHAEHRRPASVHDHGAAAGRHQLRSPGHEAGPDRNQRRLRARAPGRFGRGRGFEQVYIVMRDCSELTISYEAEMRTAIFTLYSVAVGIAYTAILCSFLPHKAVYLILLGMLFICLFSCISVKFVQKNQYSNIQYILLLPLIPFVFVISIASIGFMTVVIIVLLWPFVAIQHKKKNLNSVRKMNCKRRYIEFDDLQKSLKIGEGTLIEETGNKGPYHIWWTEDDLMSLGKPVSTKEEFLEIIAGKVKDGFNSRCLVEYISEETGKAFLTSVPTKYVTSGKLAKLFPQMKIAKVVRPLMQE